MTGYSYIHDLFEAVLKQSNAIQGRFHMPNQYGSRDINTDNVDALLTDYKPEGPKYPMAAMHPPHSRSSYGLGKAGGWERYRILIWFLKTTHYGAGSDINPDTLTSDHLVRHDWDDMKRCAVNFKRALEKLQKTLPSSERRFRITNNQALMVPVSSIGIDRASGVRLDFDLDIYIGCDTIEDYPENLNLDSIAKDSHPEHDLI